MLGILGFWSDDGVANGGRKDATMLDAEGDEGERGLE